MARWACFQASSFGMWCQLMAAIVPRFAAPGKPRGLVAIARAFTYILSHENRARRYRAPWAARRDRGARGSYAQPQLALLDMRHRRDGCRASADPGALHEVRRYFL